MDCADATARGGEDHRVPAKTDNTDAQEGFLGGWGQLQLPHSCCAHGPQHSSCCKPGGGCLWAVPSKCPQGSAYNISSRSTTRTPSFHHVCHMLGKYKPVTRISQVQLQQTEKLSKITNRWSHLAKLPLKALSMQNLALNVLLEGVMPLMQRVDCHTGGGSVAISAAGAECV